MKVHACGALGLPDLLRGLAAYAAAPGAGVACDRFRRGFAASLGVPVEQVWLFGAGRSALQAVVACLGLGAQDEALLPGYTCVVVPNVFRHLGVPVRYVDIAPSGVNPTAQAVAAAIGARTRVVVLPHNFGLAMRGIAGLRVQFPDVLFIEDAAHAWGSRGDEGRPLGTLGQASFFSFEYSKCLTTGLGGALVINDPSLRERFAARHRPGPAPGAHALAGRLATLLYHLSIARAPQALRRGLDALLRAPARALGLVAGTAPVELQGDAAPDYALGLHDLCAAIGLVQLRDAQHLWDMRRAQADDYAALLRGATRVRLPQVAPGEVLLRYPVVLHDGADREAAIEELRTLGIEAGLWFDDVVHPRGSARWGYHEGDCPQGEALAQRMLNLPLGRHARLSASQRAGLRAWAGGGAR